MEPAASLAVIVLRGQEAVMSDHWRATSDRFDVMRGIGEDGSAYATGWTISGLATLGVIVAVWIFAI
jgi:hypothetical protein